MTMRNPQRATVVGLGLIGGSIAMALRRRGWVVSGQDVNEDQVTSALEKGIIDIRGVDEDSDLVFIATPVKSVIAEVRKALTQTSCPVTDVGSVKSPIVAALGSESRFVPGHPMAGSEMSRLEGADPNIFSGATWITTPTDHTDEDAYRRVNAVIQDVFQAQVVAMAADNHDELVAAVSHVPHLTAATLVQLASSVAGEYQSTLMKLAAGGFRDMTRVAAGDPEMWVDVCLENKDAITRVLDELSSTLDSFRDAIKEDASGVVSDSLRSAQAIRRTIPARFTKKLAEIKVPISDRTGVLRDVTTLATDLDVNIVDIEIAHSAGGGSQGMLILIVEDSSVQRLYGGLKAKGFQAQVAHIGAAGSTES